MTKCALIVWGGWAGHEPEAGAAILADMLKDEGFDVDIRNETSAFLDPALQDLSLIVPIYTMSSIEKVELGGLEAAVRGGVGLAGYHGGMGDAFRNEPDYQFICGGQWVAHPGDIIDYQIDITRPDDPIMAGLSSFTYRSEQYYMHVDPANEVLATTTFSGEHAPWIEGTVMPVAWKRHHGRGRVFYSSLGHVASEFDVPEMATIIQTRHALGCGLIRTPDRSRRQPRQFLFDSRFMTLELSEAIGDGRPANCDQEHTRRRTARAGTRGRADVEVTGSKKIRLGTGAGFSADRLEPAVDLVREGGLDAIIFECVGERTLAFGHRDQMADPGKGYNPLLERRLHAVLPGCTANGTTLITNMGVANPNAAANQALEVARDLGLYGRKIAAIGGDDVTALIAEDTELDEPGLTVGDVGGNMVGANAYLGADAILPALNAGADVVITGRAADPSLFLAPLCHAFGWRLDDWPRLGAGTLVGHLMECAAQVTGGYFADPGRKDVANLAYVGFPLAEVDPDGGAIITKLEQAGGEVSERTVKEQLLYEVHDPGAYRTPDVMADFSNVTIARAGDDRVRVGGANGAVRPEHLKVTVAFDSGFLAEAGISYAGPGAGGRAVLARDILKERMTRLHGIDLPLRLDLVGQSALHATAGDAASPMPIEDIRDVRVRTALRSDRRDLAELLLWEVESLLCCGPAGGGGFRGQITPSVVTHSTFLERERVQPTLRMVET